VPIVSSERHYGNCLTSVGTGLPNSFAVGYPSRFGKEKVSFLHRGTARGHHGRLSPGGEVERGLTTQWSGRPTA
jgi:hypothetical protein